LNPFIESELIISAPSEKEKVKIVAENGALELEISPDDFLFAKSDDNYVELYYFINLQKNRKVIRNTLKNIQALFPLQNKFYRCHKSYLINLDQVNHISGNAQGYKFHLKNTEDLIPVSRSNNQFVKNYFTNRPKNTQIASKSV
jgi:DNA-binding LytR/AlgR family response regulator